MGLLISRILCVLQLLILIQNSDAAQVNMARLEQVFKSFCAFGAGKSGEALMDNAKFAKLFRDLKLLDKKLTATDVDIIFNKVKAKTERKINFTQFKESLKLAADKKYPGDPEGLKKLEAKIAAGKGPEKHGVHGGTDRMVDTSKYTGSYKERSDKSGPNGMVHTSKYRAGHNFRDRFDKSG